MNEHLQKYTKDEDYPLVEVDFKPHCCKMSEQHFSGITQHYIRLNDPQAKRLDGSTVNGGRYDIAAILDLERWGSFEEYMAEVKKRHKGAAIRHARKAWNAGLRVGIFSWQLFIPDVVEINHSMPERCGKPMKPGYLRGVEEMGGYPGKKTTFKPGPCNQHHVVPWGVFLGAKDYSQGSVVTHEKLVAYIKFLRLGQMVLYTLILGHGDFLKLGVMYYLHFWIMSWVYEQKIDPWVDGIRYICYAQFFSGNHGLRQWKKKVLFEPARLIIYD